MHNKKSKVSCVFYAHSHSQFLCTLARFDLAKPGCVPASPAAHFLCSTGRIRQDISAISFCSCKLLWRIDECVLLPCFNAVVPNHFVSADWSTFDNSTAAHQRGGGDADCF